MANMPNAPLVYMIGMVRFPKVPDLARFVPGFHDGIRSDYPLPDDIVAQGTNAQIDLGSIRFEHVETKVWQFAAPDRSFAFILGDEFIALHTASYWDHQDFACRFEAGLRGLLHVPGIGITWVQSIGIRYIDLIVLRPGESLAQYLRPQLLPIQTFAGDDSLELLESMSVTAYRTGFGALRVQALYKPPRIIAAELDTPFVARNGWKPPRPDGEFAVLDIDHGARFDPPKAMDASFVRQRIVDLRGATHAAFHSLPTDFALQVWKTQI